jgi:uncharacterized membrane protein
MEAKKMTDQFGTMDITSDDKLWAALSYIFSPIVPIILLLIEDKKNRPFIRYHAVQSLVLGILLIVIMVFTFGCGGIIWLVMLYWAYKAYQGTMIEVPVLTNFIKDQKWV